MNTRTTLALAVLALPLVAAGCGGPRLVTVKGKLTHKGEPVPSTLVTFLPDDGSRPSKGVTDDEGRFTLRYSRDEEGATPGRGVVFLTYVVSNEEENRQIPPKASKQLRAAIAKCGDPKTSGLRYEIVSSGQVIGIDLD